ncbi:MAG: NAD(P)H-hydrate dehydratase [Clostridiales bacterium]|nr:NAD(P)H-hydrate dehydratase [Clostridiales bacterium]
MKRVLTAKGAKLLDSHMISDLGIPSMVLMENAAAAVCSQISNENGLILVLCGVGNNGGDGIAIARKLMIEGKNVHALMLGNPITDDAKLNLSVAEKLGLPITFIENVEQLQKHLSEKPAIIVDALFGIGLSREILGLYSEAIELTNQTNAIKIAVDTPSGINADTGEVMGCAFKADVTVSFQTAKRGHLVFPGRDYSGKLIIAKIGDAIKDYVFDSNEYLIEESDVQEILPKRKANSHKGNYGKALLIAGSNEYVGACVMSATATLRAGAGLLKVVTPNKVAQVLYSSLPEAMVYSDFYDWNGFLAHSKEFEKLLDWADCIAIGSGMGDSEAIAIILEMALSTNKPIIIDADGLNALAKSEIKLHNNVLITPHIGEFSRLSQKTKSAILADSVSIANTFAKENAIVLLLKGATTIISAYGERIYYDVSGNPGLSTGGSGDVLTGLILGLLAQGLSLEHAASCGSLLLGIGADEAVKHLSLRGILPTDVLEHI